MNVKQLREIIKDMPDEIQLVTSARDHSYRSAGVFSSTALFDAETGTWTEDHGEDTTPEAEYGKRTDVLIFS